MSPFKTFHSWTISSSLYARTKWPTGVIRLSLPAVEIPPILSALTTIERNFTIRNVPPRARHARRNVKQGSEILQPDSQHDQQEEWRKDQKAEGRNQNVEGSFEDHARAGMAAPSLLEAARAMEGASNE